MTVVLKGFEDKLETWKRRRHITQTNFRDSISVDFILWNLIPESLFPTSVRFHLAKKSQMDPLHPVGLLVDDFRKSQCAKC